MDLKKSYFLAPVDECEVIYNLLIKKKIHKNILHKYNTTTEHLDELK